MLRRQRRRVGGELGEMTDYEALVDYKLAVLDAIRAELAEERTDKIVMLDVEEPSGPDLQFFVLRFTLSGERLASLDEAWLRVDPENFIRSGDA